MHDFSSDSPVSDSLHFSKLVWKSATKLGMALTISRDSGRLVCSARYDNPSDLSGLFLKNVLPLGTSPVPTTTVKTPVILTSITTECLAAFRTAALAQHNTLRAKHGAQSLTQDATLDAAALNWAKTLASANKFEHSTLSYGENLYLTTIYNSGLTMDVCSSNIKFEDYFFLFC